VRPTLLTVRGVAVPSYPAMLCLGIVLGVVVQNAAANDAGIAADRVWIATLVMLPLALVGARLLHVAGHWHLYRHDLPRVVDRSSGGMVMYGGLIVMLPASLVVLARLDLPYWRFWDATILLILPAMVCTRLGCHLNGCCAGRETDGRFGVAMRGDDGTSARRIPTQLLEAGLAGALLVAAVALRPTLDRPGQLFLLVAAGYGIGRTLLQPLRGARTRVDGLLLLSAAIAVLAVVALVLVP
jgi:phosphatidylglycerol:prolipoprotein diacylglycerol transferase